MKLPSDYLEQGWCQRAFALNADGIELDESSPKAVAWCHSGAAYAALFEHVSSIKFGRYRTELEKILQEKYGTSHLVDVNDEIYDPETGQAQAVADAREAERRAGLR